jgi:hypothetical protein
MELVMIPRKAVIISMLLFSMLMSGWCLVSGTRFPIRIFLWFHFALLLCSRYNPATNIGKNSVDSVTRIRWTTYRPRMTDAGKWVEAPVAELDKSTFGKLLASRLRREPGLDVVKSTERPEVCSDALYDPELDGR